MTTIFTKDDTNAFNQNFLIIELENPTGLAVSKAEFRCGKIFKTFKNPVFPLEIDFSAEETELLNYTNACYLAVYDEQGRKRTCEGHIIFNARKGVV